MTSHAFHPAPEPGPARRRARRLRKLLANAPSLQATTPVPAWDLKTGDVLLHDNRRCEVTRIRWRANIPSGGRHVTGFILWLDDLASRLPGGMTGRTETLTVLAGTVLLQEAPR